MIRAIKGVMLILMLDCEESARLTSESFDRPLTRSERWALKIHQACCRSSHRVARQMEMISEAMKKPEATEQLTAASDSLSDDARDRIRQKLRDIS